MRWAEKQFVGEEAKAGRLKQFKQNAHPEFKQTDVRCDWLSC